jgi:hypothetical protein
MSPERSAWPSSSTKMRPRRARTTRPIVLFGDVSGGRLPRRPPHAHGTAPCSQLSRVPRSTVQRRSSAMRRCRSSERKVVSEPPSGGRGAAAGARRRRDGPGNGKQCTSVPKEEYLLIDFSGHAGHFAGVAVSEDKDKGVRRDVVNQY